MAEQSDIHFFDKDFDKKVEEALSFYHVPGLSIGVLHKGKVYAKGYGYSNVESKIPVTPKTLFAGASTTKSFLAAAVSIIAADNNYPDVNFTTPIASILPDDFVLHDEWATQHITIEDALCHRTGYPRHDLSYGMANDTLSDVVRTLRHLPPTVEPRTQMQYNNMMYMAVSHAVERVTGSAISAVFRKHIWDPLDMKSTFLGHKDACDYLQVSRDPDVSIATPYIWTPADKNNLTPLATVSAQDNYLIEPRWVPEIFAGAGSNITTVLDYLKYLECMLYQSAPIPKRGHKELRKARIPVFESFWETTSDQASPDMGPMMYTLGWFHRVYAPAGSRGVEIWQHSGGFNGFGAEMRYIPALDLAIVALGNSSAGPNYAGTALSCEIIDDVLGVPQSQRFDWKKEWLFKEAQDVKDLSGLRDSLFKDLDISELHKGTEDLDEFQGVFENIAYREMAVQVPHGLTADGVQLRITPSPRAFADIFELHHVTGDWFLLEKMYPHPKTDQPLPATAGFGRLSGRSRALFKRDGNGKITSLGLELEASLVQKAAKDGHGEERKETDWASVEHGMIWFEKTQKEIFTVNR